MDNGEKETAFDILNKVGFFNMKHTKRLSSARMKDALYNLPKTKTKIINSPLTAIEDIGDSYEETSDNDLEGQGIDNIQLRGWMEHMNIYHNIQHYCYLQQT